MLEISISGDLLRTIVMYLIAVCVVGVASSAIVEVIKHLVKFKNDYQINWIVLVICEILMCIVYAIYVSNVGCLVTWYSIAAVIVGGIFSAGTAIIGFDDYWKPAFKKIAEIFKYFGKQSE